MSTLDLHGDDHVELTTEQRVAAGHVFLLAWNDGSATSFHSFSTFEDASTAGRVLRLAGFLRSVRVLVDGVAVVWS